MGAIVCLTTVHRRYDPRILIKEARSLANKLPREVVLIVADGNGHAQEGQGGVSIHDLGGLLGGRIRRAIIGPWRAFHAIRKIRPEIVHFHDPELIPLGVFLKVLGYKVIYDVHEDVPRQILSKSWLHWIIRKPVAWAMSIVEWCSGKAFDAIVPATPKIAERFPQFKTVTVQNYAILTEMMGASPLAYADRPKHFAYPGAIAPLRGGLEMVRAIELLDDIPDVRLEFAGTFNPQDFAGTMQSLAGWSSVIYHGEVSREGVANILGNVRAGLVTHHPVPNEIDAQPIKIYEYMSAGLPVIASDFPPLRGIIDGCGCGLLVDPLDPQAIAKAMRWVLDNASKAREMGLRGREAVERFFNWDIEAVKLIDLYIELLGS